MIKATIQRQCDWMKLGGRLDTRSIIVGWVKVNIPRQVCRPSAVQLHHQAKQYKTGNPQAEYLIIHKPQKTRQPDRFCGNDIKQG